MSTNSNSKPNLTPEQAVTIFRELAAHPQLRFLNLQEHATVQEAVAALDTVVKSTVAPLTVVQ